MEPRLRPGHLVEERIREYAVEVAAHQDPHLRMQHRLAPGSWTSFAISVHSPCELRACTVELHCILVPRCILDAKSSPSKSWQGRGRCATSAC